LSRQPLEAHGACGKADKEVTRSQETLVYDSCFFRSEDGALRETVTLNFRMNQLISTKRGITPHAGDRGEVEQ
jgi:hypothetical protein